MTDEELGRVLLSLLLNLPVQMWVAYQLHRLWCEERDRYK